ncbi:hypothetical protein [Clostridium sp. UBA1056]|uniref:hypothetical protein n=1 Tax=unclassified Clostridium TaxID=2614128 RepID=UPI00321718BA
MLPYMLNFNLKKVAELNKKGLSKFESEKLNRAQRAEKTTDEEIKKKINKEKIDRLILDSDDILILRFIYTIGYSSKAIRDTEDNNFFWVKYDALFAEYENLLLIDKSALNTRLNKYVKMNLIERKCVKNQDGTFSFFKITGLTELVYIPIDSQGNKPVDGQVHFSEVVEEVEYDVEIDEEKADYELRVDLIEEVLDTRVSSEIKSLLANFKDQYEFFKYFDTYILPHKEEGKLNKCTYIAKNLRMFFNGKLN